MLGLALVQKAKDMLEKALPLIGSEHELAQATLTFLQKIGKHIQDGAVSPGVADTAMQQFMAAQRGAAPQAALLSALRGGAAGGGAPPMPPGGAPGAAM